MKILIIGAGSIGAFIAARLSRKAEVTLVCRDESSRGWANGITLCGLEEAVMGVPVISWAGVKKAASGELRSEPRYILIATKIFDLPAVFGELKPILNPDDHIVLLQNGLGVSVEAALHQPSHKFGRGVCWLGVRLEEAGRVRVAGVGNVDLAGGDRAAMTKLADIFSNCGLKADWCHDVSLIEWRKALWNVSLNGLCALADAPNGAALENKWLRPLFDGLLDEAMLVAKAEGVHLDGADMEKVFQATRITAMNFNSTLQDLRAGRPTEMHWLNGAVVRLGERHGLMVPAHRMIEGLVRFREERGLRNKRA